MLRSEEDEIGLIFPQVSSRGRQLSIAAALLFVIILGEQPQEAVLGEEEEVWWLELTPGV